MATFAAVGQSASLFCAPQHGPTVAISGTFVATVWLERQESAGAWVPVQVITAPITISLLGKPGTYRLNCTAYTSGTVTYTLTSTPDKVLELTAPDGTARLTVDADGAVVESNAAINNSTLGGTTPAALLGTLLNLSAEDALTAHAGGTQAAALALSATKSVHRVTTVGTAADSVKLPAATVGAIHLVINDAASNSMQVFGSGTDTINSVATATGVAQAAGKTALYVCAVAGNWNRLLSA